MIRFPPVVVRTAVSVWVLCMATLSVALPQDTPEVGDMAPDFALQSIDGLEHRLSELRGRKRAVIVFFRGTW